MKQFSLNWILIILYSFSFAQTPKTNGEHSRTIDSLKAELAKATEDTTKVTLLNKIALALTDTAPQKALQFAEQALRISSALNHSHSHSKTSSYDVAGSIHENIGNYDIALELYNKALNIYESESAEKKIASTCNQVGVVYKNMGRYKEALEYYFRAMKISTQNNDRQLLANSYNNIGVVYYYRKDYKNALKYYELALEINKASWHKNDIAKNYNNIGIVHALQGDISGAFKYFNKTLKIREETGDLLEIAACYNNLAEIFIIENNYDKALEYQQKALSIQQQAGNKREMIYSLIGLGDLCVQNGTYSKALQYYNDALHTAQEINAADFQKNAHKKLSDAYKAMSDYKNACTHFFQYSQLKDSLFSEAKTKEIGKIEAKYEFELAEMERERIKNEEVRIENEKIKRRNLLQYSGILIFIVLLGAGVLGLGKINVNEKVAEGLIFFMFLLLFEFLLVFLDPYLERWTGGEPAWKLAVNSLIAAMIFPLHSFLEEKQKKIIFSRLEQRKNIKKPLLFFALLMFHQSICVSPSRASGNLTDSLETITVSNLSDTTKIIAMNKLALDYLLTDYNATAALAEKAAELAGAISYKNSLVESHRLIGLVHYYEGDYEKALASYHKAHAIAVESHNKKGVCDVLNEIATFYKKHNDLNKAKELLKNALAAAEDVHYDAGIANSLNNMGIIYELNGNYPEALNHYQRSLAIKEKLGDQRGIPYNLINMAGVYSLMGNDEDALFYYNRAITMRRELGDKKGIAICYVNLAELYIRRNDHRKALEELRKCIDLSKQVGHKELNSYAYRLMSESHNNLGDYKNAFQYFKIHLELKDSLFNEEKSKEIGKLEARHEYEMAELKRKQEEEEQQRQRQETVKRRNILQYSGILIALVVLFSVIAVVIPSLRGISRPMPVRFLEGLIFFTFLLLFEFILVLLDPYVEAFTGGEPMYKLVFNAGIAAGIFPLHAFFERLLKRRLSNAKRQNQKPQAPR